jgi:DNA-binding SARP family transcriptional activator/tetratricopeptide (TPR) repeat protein
MVRTGMAVLDVVLLGAVALGSGAAAVRLPAKLTALAAYVAVRGGAERSELAEMLWGADSRHNLRVALHQLRRALPDPGVLDAAPSRRVALAAGCDAVRFEHAVADGRLEAAVEAWRRAAGGRPHRDVFMAGFDLPSAVGFQDWLEHERSRLGGLYLHTLWRLAEGSEAAHEPGAAVAWLRALLEEDPLDERAHRRLMRLALAGGDAAGALDQYDLCRRVLRVELGVEPSPATTEVAEQARAAGGRAWMPDASALEASAPEAEAPEAGAPEAGAPAARALVAAAPTPMPIGRERDLETLVTLLPTASPLSILGPGGVGKSRTAAALVLRAQHGYDTVAHAPVDGVDDAPGVLFAVAAALGVAGDSEDRVVAAVRDRLVRRRQLLLLDGIEPRHRATTLLVRLLEGLPPGRCIVTSREAVGIAGEVGFRLEGLPRPSGRGWRDAGAARLFTAAARRSYAGFDLLPGDRAPLAALVEAVDGLPLGLVLAASLVPAFSLREIARIARERPEEIGGDGVLALPERHRSLDRVLEASIEGMPPERIERLVTSSVFAAAFDRHAAEAVAGATVADLVSWERAGWLSAAGADRWTMHERVRAFLARRAHPEALCAARSHHAHHYLDALRRSATTLRSARGVGGVEAWVRDLPELQAAWQAVDPDELAGAVEPMALLLDVRGRHAEGALLFGRGLVRRPRALSVRAALHTALAAVENRVGRRLRALRRARLAAALAERAGVAPTAARAAWQAAEVLYDLGRYDEAEAVLDDLDARGARPEPVARAAALRLRSLVVLGRSRGAGQPLAPSPAYVRQVEAARAGFERCLALAREVGDVLAEAEALHDLGYCSFAVGDFAAALTAFRLAERRHRAAGARRRRNIEVYWIGVACTMIGDHPAAERALRAALRAMDEAGETPKALEVVQAFGQLWSQRGDPARAAVCHLAAMAAPGLDARVRQAIVNWHLPPLRAAIDARGWAALEARALTLGYRDTVTELLRTGSLPLPTEEAGLRALEGVEPA